MLNENVKQTIRQIQEELNPSGVDDNAWTRPLAVTDIPEAEKDLLRFINESTACKYIPFSGTLNGLFYQTVFVANEGIYLPYVLFENNSDIKVNLESKKRGEGQSYNYIELDGVKYIFNTQEQLWFKSNLVNTVDNQGIANFIQGKVPEKAQLIEKVKKIIADYYDFYDIQELDIVFAHIVHTYILGLLGKTFYLLLDGEKNTGKSSLQNVMALLQHNGCFSGNSTMASLVRKIHFLRASVNLDEIDKYDPRDKPVITGILNTGAYEGGTREITNMDGKNGSDQLRVYHTFSAKTFSVNKMKFDSSLLSRCQTIHTVRNRKMVKDVYSLPEEEKQIFQDLRNELFAYTLKHGRIIAKEIKLLQKNSAHFGRKADIFSIILGIIKHFTEDCTYMRSYLNGKEEMEKEDDSQNDRLFHAMIFLLELAVKCQEQEQNIDFSNQDLTDYINKKLGLLIGADFSATPASIGRLLKSNKIVQSSIDRKREPGKGNYKYIISKQRIAEIADRIGNDEFKNYIQKISFTGSQNNENLASGKPVNNQNSHFSSNQSFTDEELPF